MQNRTTDIEPSSAILNSTGPLSAANTSLYDAEDGNYGNRVLACLAVSPAGRGLSTSTPIREFLTALQDAVKGI